MFTLFYLIWMLSEQLVLNMKFIRFVANSVLFVCCGRLVLVTLEIKTACFLWMFSIFVGWWHPLWCNIDDNNIAVLLHSVIYCCLTKCIFWKVSGMMYKGRQFQVLPTVNTKGMYTYRETNFYPLFIEIEVRKWEYCWQASYCRLLSQSVLTAHCSPRSWWQNNLQLQC